MFLDGGILCAAALHLTKFSRFGRAHGSHLPNRLTGLVVPLRCTARLCNLAGRSASLHCSPMHPRRQVPLKRRAPVVRFVGVVKPGR